MPAESPDPIASLITETFPLLEQRRPATVVQLRTRECSFAELGDALFRFECAPIVESIWRGTCCVKTPEGHGSGFFVDGGADGTVVVTNADVVGLHHRVLVEWMHQADINSRSANVIAIDYPHDLAILSVHSGQTPLPRALELGDPPRPGEDLWLCGYPLSAENASIESYRRERMGRLPE